MKNAIALLTGLALMACTPSTPTPTTPATDTPASTASTEPMPPPQTVAPDPNADTCNKTQYAALVGKPATDPGVPPASATVRHIKPGDSVTMDHSPARLNVDIDASGNITAFRCG